MKVSTWSAALWSIAATATVWGASIQPARADEVCRPCPFNCGQLGIDRDDCSNRDRRYGQCCVDLDNEGFAQLRDRERGRDRYDHRGRDDRDRDRWSHWDNRPRDRHDHGNHYGWNHDRGQYSNTNWNRWNDGSRPGESHGDRPGEIQGDCPNGFHWNDRNCTGDERKRGCMDMRSPSNRICVGWRR